MQTFQVLNYDIRMFVRERERDLRAVANIRKNNEVFYRIKFSIFTSEFNGLPRILVTPANQNRAL